MKLPRKDKNGNGVSFRVNKLDVLIALTFTHLLQASINPELITIRTPFLYGGVMALTAVTITFLSALLGYIFVPRVVAPIIMAPQNSSSS